MAIPNIFILHDEFSNMIKIPCSNLNYLNLIIICEVSRHVFGLIRNVVDCFGEVFNHRMLQNQRNRMKLKVFTK